MRGGLGVLFASVILLIYLLPFTSAHLDAGEDRVVEEYLIDFGYSPEIPTTAERTFFSFNLLNKTSNEIIYLTDALITISDSKGIIFAGKLYPEEGNIVMSYLFSEDDNYNVEITFNNGKEVLVKSNFKVRVKETLRENMMDWIIFLIMVILIVVNVKLFIKSNKKKVR